MAWGTAEWIAFGGLALAASGLNLANALNSWLRSRDKLNEKLDELRRNCHEDNEKLEALARTKLAKFAKAFKTLSYQVCKVTETTNELSEDVHQIKLFLQQNHNFIIKSKAEKIDQCLSPFDSLDLETTSNHDYSEP